MIHNLTPEEIVKHGIEGYPALARCVVLRAVQDYKIGIKMGYIHKGGVTPKLKTALAKQRKARSLRDGSTAIFRLEANTAADDYCSAIQFVHGGAMDTLLDMSWKDVDGDYIREVLARDDKSRSTMRGE